MANKWQVRSRFQTKQNSSYHWSIISRSGYYESALKRPPKGNLIKKKIKGREYWYMQAREGRKVHFDYVAKPSASMIEKYRKAKADRARYRKLLSQVRKQIKYLERIVRARQAI